MKRATPSRLRTSRERRVHDAVRSRHAPAPSARIRATRTSSWGSPKGPPERLAFALFGECSPSTPGSSANGLPLHTITPANVHSNRWHHPNPIFLYRFNEYCVSRHITPNNTGRRGGCRRPGPRRDRNLRGRPPPGGARGSAATREMAHNGQPAGVDGTPDGTAAVKWSGTASSRPEGRSRRSPARPGFTPRCRPAVRRPEWASRPRREGGGRPVPRSGRRWSRRP